MPHCSRRGRRLLPKIHGCISLTRTQTTTDHNYPAESNPSPALCQTATKNIIRRRVNGKPCAVNDDASMTWFLAEVCEHEASLLDTTSVTTENDS